MTKENKLAELLSSGMITLDDVPRVTEEMKILDRHKNEIYQGNDGRWRTYLDDPYKKGARKRISSNDKIVLEKKIIEYYKEFDAKKNEEVNIIFEELYYEWQDYKNKTDLKTRSNNKYHSTYKRFYQGNPIVKMKVVDIKILDVKQFLCGMVKEHKLYKKQSNDMAIPLRGVLQYALEKELIEKNPAEGYKIPRHILYPDPIPKAEDEVFSAEEQKAYLQCIETRKNRENLAYLAIALNFHVFVN